MTRDELNAKHRQYYYNHKEEFKVRRTNYSLKNREYLNLKNRELYNRKKDIIKKQHARTRFLYRKNALDAYGGQICVKCGDTRFAVLTFHHTNHDGAEHRRNGVGSGLSFILWLRRNNYPEGFQVLCQNCNWIEYIEHHKKQPTDVKKKFMDKLGGKCVICGKDDLRILTVHHINHDGTKHRQQLGGKGHCGGGTGFYRKILKSGDFSGLECRCLSCNCLAESEEFP